MLRMRSQQMEQISPPSQLRYYKQFIIHTKDIIQPNNIIVPPQFSQYIHLFLEFGNVLRVIPEHYAFASEFLSFPGFVGGVSLGFASGGDADLSVGAFADDEVAVEEVGGTSLGGVQLRCGGRVGGRTGGRDVVADPVAVVSGVVLRPGGGAVTGSRATPSRLFFGAGGGAGALVVLHVAVVGGGGGGVGLLLFAVVVVHDLHVGLGVASCHLIRWLLGCHSVSSCC